MQPNNHPLHKGTIWAAGAFIVAGWGGMMGNSSLAFSIGSFLLGLLLALAYYLKLQDWPTEVVVSGVVAGLILISLVSKPLADAWEAPPIRKTVGVSNVNSGDWEGIAVGEKANLTQKWFSKPPILRSQFVKEKPYPLDLEIGHGGRLVYLTSVYFTLRFKDTVKIQLSEEHQREWRQQKSKKDGYLEYQIRLSSVYRDTPKKVWPPPRFIFPTQGRYDFEYELDASGSDYNEHAFDLGVLKGEFLIEVYE